MGRILNISDNIIMLDNLAYIMPKDNKKQYLISFVFDSMTTLDISYDTKEARDNLYKTLLNELMQSDSQGAN